jgi:hypothetical protein
MHLAIAQLLDRFARVGQHAFDGREARHLGGRGNAMRDRVDAREAIAVLVDDRRRQRRYRAAATENSHARQFGLCIQHAHTVDEGAAVGQVAVVHACVDAALGDGIGLPLERAAGVDHQLDVHRLQNSGEPGAHGIAAPAFAGCGRVAFQLIDFALQLVWVAARDHQFDARRQRQVPAHDAAEVAVATDHHHPECHSILP